MRPETISVITKLLNNEVVGRKQHMLDCINMQIDQGVISELIKGYQEAYSAQQDFVDWLDEQEEDDAEID